MLNKENCRRNAYEPDCYMAPVREGAASRNSANSIPLIYSAEQPSNIQNYT
jgi:hypothetical protein